ncbi:MAG: SpoIIE family protein phosphatase, partial [Bacteroidota bacterium]
RTLTARRANKQKVGIISSLINISVVLNNLKRYDESIKSLEEALDIAREMNDPEQMKSVYGMLSETYEKAGDTEKSLYWYEYYKTFTENLSRQKVTESKAEAEAAQLRAQLAEAEKRNKELELQKTRKENINLSDSLSESLLTLSKQELALRNVEQEQRIQELELLEAKERQKLAEQKSELDEQKLRNTSILAAALIAGIALVLVFAVFIFRSYQAKKQTNAKLEEQNEELETQRDRIFRQSQKLEVALKNEEEARTKIVDSINYAQRIQQAMLDREPRLDQLLPEHFGIFKPRDVVSGDFYWYTWKNGKILVAAVDCTGHGVPGAFMSMIGNNLLDTIVNTNGITAPDIVLAAMHEGVTSALHQEQTENRDGMDMALIVIDKENQTLEYAGAGRPLLIVKNGALETIKGDRHGIGGASEKKQAIRFTKHKIPLDAPTAFYIYSDGFTDQFGGEGDKKLGTKRMKELCLEYHHLSVAEQEEKFDTAFEEWRGDSPQIDDVLLIGGRV